MKIRSSFVSNSSSSSFVVPFRNALGILSSDEQVGWWLTQEQLDELLYYGFIPRPRLRAEGLQLCGCNAWDDRPENYCAKHPVLELQDEKACMLTYQVTCNEDDVLYFLFGLGVPFTAACHYGDYSILYTGGKDYYYCRNTGVALESMVLYHNPVCIDNIYGWELNEARKGPGVEKRSVAKFMKEYKKWMTQDELDEVDTSDEDPLNWD